MKSKIKSKSSNRSQSRRRRKRSSCRRKEDVGVVAGETEEKITEEEATGEVGPEAT